MSCHSTGAVGAQMLTLDTAGDAAEVADGLAVVTRTSTCPHGRHRIRASSCSILEDSIPMRSS